MNRISSTSVIAVMAIALFTAPPQAPVRDNTGDTTRNIVSIERAQPALITVAQYTRCSNGRCY